MEKSTKSTKRKVTWVEPLVDDLQIPGVSTTFDAAYYVEKIFWVVFLAISFLLTGYNVVRVSNEFMESPVITKMTPVLGHERSPPDMELCLPYNLNYYYVRGEDSCAPFSYFKEILANVTAINTTDELATALASKNILVREAVVTWIDSYNELEFFRKRDRETIEREKEGLAYYRKARGDANFTFNSLRAKMLLQPNGGIRDVAAINRKGSTHFILALDKHLRSIGVSVALAWTLYSKELLKLFNPRYEVNVGAYKFKRIVKPTVTTRNTIQSATPSSGEICLRLLLKEDVRSYDGVGYVRIFIDRAASTALQTCNSSTIPESLNHPFVTLQPYAHSLSHDDYDKLMGVHERRKVARLMIRAEYESHPSEGCEENSSDIDLCHLKCRYRYIRDRCKCSPPMVRQGARTYGKEKLLDPRFVLQSVPLLRSQKVNLLRSHVIFHPMMDHEMRECNLTDYFHSDCYSFHTDGAEDEEDSCKRDCKLNCTITEWAFTDEQVFDDGDNTTTNIEIKFSTFRYPRFVSELKLTWFNVLADVGGALGLFLGLSIFSVVHTIVLPLHHYMKNRKVLRKQAAECAVADAPASTELREVSKNATELNGH